MFSGQIPTVTQFSQNPGGPLVSVLKGINSLSQSNMDTKIKEAQAQYAPYQDYANAFLATQKAQWLPYQYRMQAASNPLLWMAAEKNPALQQQLSQMMSNPMQGMGGNMPNIPLPNSPGNGMLGTFLNKIGLGNSSQPLNAINQSQMGLGNNAMNGLGVPNQHPSSQNAIQNSTGDGGGSPLVPATTDNAIAGTMTAPYVENPHAAGKLIQDPNNPTKTISIPTSKQTTQLQNQLSAAKRVVPQMQSLSALWKPFLTIQGKASMVGAAGKNLFGSQSELPSQYVDAKMAALTTVESYLKSIGVPVTVDVQNKLNGMIEPMIGEADKGYTNRIQRETQRIVDDFEKQSQQQLNQGYSTNTAADSPSQVSSQSSEPGNVSSGVGNNAGFDVNKFLSYKFNGSDEFNQSLSSLSPDIRQQVLAEMSRRGGEWVKRKKK